MDAFQNSLARQIALVAVAAMLGTAPAHAAIFWSESDPMVMSQPASPQPAQPKRPKAPRRAATKPVTQVREAAKPQGPLIISISIDRQTLKVYDANGLYAESPVSTGMRGHSTPMGTFSVIQKNKFHRSNIYSGAPMPYMQRITWSGVAMHAGVLPGYPASHGCIRMPMAFAVKLWGWTRMGARVVIAPGELSPAEFTHPLLTAQKPAPTPIASAVPAPGKSAALLIDAQVTSKDAMSSDSLALKPSVGQDSIKAIAATGSASRRDQTQTADASGSMVQTKGTTSLSDESPARPTMASPATTAPDDKTTQVGAVADDLRADGDAAQRIASEAIAVDAAAIPPKPAEIAQDTSADASKAPIADTTEAPKATEAPKSTEVTKVSEVTKDQSRQGDPDQTATAKPDLAPVAPKRSGQIAVLVSRKDSKIYVRQNFAPLFDVPVTVTPSDRPLGTHVFTARADTDDARTFHWSVVSLPVPARGSEDDGASRRRKATGAVEVKAAPVPDTAAEALDRLQIPDDAMARITEALATGGSIIVSDLGIAAGGETGQGTDFIVPLR